MTITAKQIAEDALAQLDAGVIKAAHGFGYVYTEVDGPCRVCALGACFLGLRRLGVLGDIRYYCGRDSLVADMRPYFSRGQLALIEEAFENWSYEQWMAATGSTSSEEYCAARRFADHYEDASSRLRAILINIIQGDGVFDPTREVIELHVVTDVKQQEAVS